MERGERGAGHLGLTRLLSRGSAPASVKPLQTQSGLRSCLTAHQGGDIATALLNTVVANQTVFFCGLNLTEVHHSRQQFWRVAAEGGRASGRDICGTSGVGGQRARPLWLGNKWMFQTACEKKTSGSPCQVWTKEAMIPNSSFETSPSGLVQLCWAIKLLDFGHSGTPSLKL